MNDTLFNVVNTSYPFLPTLVIGICCLIAVLIITWIFQDSFIMGDGEA